jgi:hypothetical protein
MANVTILPPRSKPKEPAAIKLNERQERFCQGVAAGMRKMDAYTAAGYRGAYDQSQIMRSPGIRERIKQLMTMQAFKLDVTVEKLVLELTEAFEVAKRDINPQGMVVATLGKAKLLGFLQDRIADDGKIPKPMDQPGEYREMTIEEWEAKFRPKLLQ